MNCLDITNIYNDCMKDQSCLFCKIVAGEEPSEKIWENEEFVCIRNKYPVAPTHVLVIPKSHIRKQEVATPAVSGVNSPYNLEEFWGKIMSAVFDVISELKLENSAYKLVNNGRGYAHFEHEHVHILGGTKTEPGGQT